MYKILRNNKRYNTVNYLTRTAAISAARRLATKFWGFYDDTYAPFRVTKVQ